MKKTLILYQFLCIFSLINSIFYNIMIKDIKYEINYRNDSMIKVKIFIYNDIKNNIIFNAYLKSDDKKEEIPVKCFNSNNKIIECLLEKEYFINYKKKYFFYYYCLNDCLLLINNKNLFEDKNKISFIFKPKIFKNLTLYKNYKKFFIKIDKNIINYGYLFYARKSKKLLHNLNNGFNKYIQQKNYISTYKTLREYRSLTSYKEAIKKGFHIIDADLLFTKDKIPVICHEQDLDKISDGKGTLSSKTLNELKKLNFFYGKYKHEKILTLEEFLKFSKENNIIIDLDLSHIDYVKYFKNTDEYAKIIVNIVEKYDMFNSIFFNNGDIINKIEKLKKFKNNISISISNMNEKKNIEEIKNKYNDSKIIIYNMGNLLSGKHIDEQTVKYGISLGRKIKAAKVNDRKFADKLFKWGVNYIMTQHLEPFLLKNQNEEPTKIKCNPSILNELSECEIDSNSLLIDNEIYNIYYSKNIKDPFKEINDNPIGEFKYINTNNNNKLYYSLKYLNFEEGIIIIIISNKLKKGKIIRGIIGPNYDNVAKCYQYNFICNGNNSNYLICRILKDDKEKFEYKGKYCIYSLDNYSYNFLEIEKLKINKQKIKLKIFLDLILLLLFISLKLIKKIYKI